MKNSDVKISIYGLVNQYDFLLIPTSNALAGAVGFGFPGALLGAAVGIIDEALITYNWTSTRYLSPILQGASSFATLTASRYIIATGGILNFVFSQLIISEYNKYTNKIITPIQTGIQTGYMFGFNGFIAGTGCSVIEEILIYNEVYNKHYISTAISFISITHFIKQKAQNIISHIDNASKLNIVLTTIKKLEKKFPYFLENIALITSIVKSTYETKNDLNIAVLEFQKAMGKFYKQLGQEEKYLDILEKQTISTFGFIIAEQFLYYQLVGSLQKCQQVFYSDLMNKQIWGNFKLFLQKILFHLPSLIIIKQIFINPMESYFSFKSQNLLYDQISKKWLINDVPLKILQKEGTEVLIDNLNQDIMIITDIGEELKKSYSNDIIKSIYSQYLLYQYNMQDLTIIYQVYYGCTQYISENLSKWQISYNNEIRNLESKKNTITKHDIRNVETVVTRGGFTYSEVVLKELNDQIKTLTTKQLMIKHLYKTWEDIEKYINIILKCFLVGYKAHIGQLDHNMQLKILSAIDNIASLMSWQGKNAGNIEEVKNSLDKLHTFIYKIGEVQDIRQQNLTQLQSINEYLELEDFKLSVGNIELFYTKIISLKPGMYYALTGDSGSGKSSLLSQIKGTTYNNISATGIIKYPDKLNKTQDIIFMPQDDFFPTDTTLLEAIYYPNFIYFNEDINLYSEIFTMLEKIRFCHGDNDEKSCNIESFMKNKRDWNSVLSGGQKKKALLVSVLLQKPKILLLDEPFAALHQKAIPLVQSFIKEILNDTNTLIICIDHHISNSDHFYDYELRIENKQLQLNKFYNKNIFFTQGTDKKENNNQIESQTLDNKICEVDHNFLFDNICSLEENI